MNAASISAIAKAFAGRWRTATALIIIAIILTIRGYWRSASDSRASRGTDAPPASVSQPGHSHRQESVGSRQVAADASAAFWRQVNAAAPGAWITNGLAADVL